MAELQSRGLHLAQVTEVEGREAAREAAAQGLGVAVMSRAELADDGRLKALRFSDWPVAMEEWLAWLSSRAGLHVIRAFLDTAR
jgi:DNA-binding transcriptional LysR family regulator